MDWMAMLVGRKRRLQHRTAELKVDMRRAQILQAQEAFSSRIRQCTEFPYGMDLRNDLHITPDGTTLVYERFVQPNDADHESPVIQRMSEAWRKVKG